MFFFPAQNGPTEGWEAFKNAPGGRGFVLTEYGPVASHGDPVSTFFYRFDVSFFVEF